MASIIGSVRDQPAAATTGRLARWAGAGLPVVMAVGMTGALYAGALHAGFMFDDPLDLPRASGRSFVAIFTESEESFSYRPLTFAVWKLLFLLLGRHEPAVLHGLVLGLHALNGWLVYQLGRRLIGEVAGFLAMAFFLWYPFSYQVVVYSNTLYHTLVTACALTATLLYWRWRVGEGSKARLWLALLAGGLGLLGHENGVMIAPLIFVTEGVLRLSRQVERFAWHPALFALETLAFLVAWWSVPRWAMGWRPDTASLRMNGLYLLQGLAYPVTGQLGRFSGWEGGDAQKVALVGGVALLALVAILAVRVVPPRVPAGLAHAPLDVRARWAAAALSGLGGHRPALGRCAGAGGVRMAEGALARSFSARRARRPWACWAHPACQQRLYSRHRSHAATGRGGGTAIGGDGHAGGR
jgi:hypothetical protein